MGEERPCPKCPDTPLEPVIDRDVDFFGCESCFGLWASEGNLGVYVERAADSQTAMKFASLLESATAHPAGGKHARRRCPFCGIPLDRIGFGEEPFVILDRCAEHGIWLDRSELKQVVQSSRHAAHPHERLPPPDDGPNERGAGR